MSQQRRKNTLAKVALAWAILVFLVAVLLTDWPGKPAPEVTAPAIEPYTWQCPESFERVVASHRTRMEVEQIANASTALLQKYHRTLCDTLRLRDEIVFSAAFQRIPDYVEQHAKLQDIQLTLGYAEANARHPSYNAEATGMWFTFMVMAHSVEPVEFHWVKCGLESPPDIDQCWNSQTMLGEIEIAAQLFGPYSVLRVNLPEYTFYRRCDGIRPETSFLLWECPIESVMYHPDGWSTDCTEMFAVWDRTGLLTHFRPDDGAYCSPDRLLPPVEIEPEWPDHEKSPAPTPMPDGWYHL